MCKFGIGLNILMKRRFSALDWNRNQMDKLRPTLSTKKIIPTVVVCLCLSGYTEVKRQISKILVNLRIKPF